jgi:hypothetical protein
MPSFINSAYEQIRSLWIRTILFITHPIFQRLLPDPYTKAGNVRVDTKPAHASRITMTEIISPDQCDLKVHISSIHFSLFYKICKLNDFRGLHMLVQY